MWMIGWMIALMTVERRDSELIDCPWCGKWPILRGHQCSECYCFNQIDI